MAAPAALDTSPCVWFQPESRAVPPEHRLLLPVAVLAAAELVAKFVVSRQEGSTEVDLLAELGLPDSLFVGDLLALVSGTRGVGWLLRSRLRGRAPVSLKETGRWSRPLTFPLCLCPARGPGDRKLDGPQQAARVACGSRGWIGAGARDPGSRRLCPG